PATADQARHPRRPPPAHRGPLHHARHDPRGDRQLHDPPPHPPRPGRPPPAGRSGPLFSDDATALIHATSRGLPRAVNNLAIQALIAAYASRKAIVDESSARTVATEVTSD